MKSNLKKNKDMTYDQKGNFFGTPRGKITGITAVAKHDQHSLNKSANREKGQKHYLLVEEQGQKQHLLAKPVSVR